MNAELVTIRFRVAPALDQRAQQTCKRMREQRGIHYGETMAVALALGLRQIEASGIGYSDRALAWGRS